MGIFQTKFYPCNKNKQVFPILQDQTQTFPQHLYHQCTLQFIDSSLFLHLPLLQIKKPPFLKQHNKTNQNQIKNSMILISKHKTDIINVFNDQKICKILMTYLKPIQIQILKQTSLLMECAVANWHLKSKQNWIFIKGYLSDIFKQHQNLYTGQEESQHSVDLDRTSQFFEGSEDIPLQQNRLDRVLTQISFNVQYFQGINSIAALILHFEDQDTTYKILRYLLFKVNCIQVNSIAYKKLILQLQELLNREQPQIMQAFEKYDFIIEYFCMQWIMGLFSYELKPQFGMEFLQLICLFGLQMLKVFILCLLKEMKSDILECSEQQQINQLIKNDLKCRINSKQVKQVIFCQCQNYYLNKVMKKYNNK